MHYLDLTIKEIHEALVSKKVTPLELTLEALKRAEADTNNCFEYICKEEAIEFAKSLIEPEIDNYLWGIPYLLKDNFSTKNIPTTASSNILNNYVPVYDSTVARKLKEAKAILIGKTTLDELAMGGTGMSGHKGITYNPYDDKKERLCGGSSCGSAAGVSSCIAPFAIGSDTGDSVRKPASFNGLVGIKPTWGRISRYGLFSFANSLDHVAYFTRSVEDSAIILNTLAGRDDRDMTSSFVEVEDYTKYENQKGSRFAVISEILNSVKDPILLNRFNKFVDDLRNNGFVVDFVSMDVKLLSAVLPVYFVISCAEAGSNNANLDGIKFGVRKDGASYDEIMKNSRSEGFGELIKRRFIIGSYVLFAENKDDTFIRAQKARRLIVDAYNKILSEYDAVLVPAAPGIAPKFTDSSDKLSDEYLIADNHLAIQNFAGLPSLTLPLCFDEGMPIGINVTTKKFEEKKIFEICRDFEDIIGLKNVSTNNRKGN
jgi:aspartyl-tRNA(Asn)/glutamyl-tRNA(Gln) amidotransferase subunit A